MLSMLFASVSIVASCTNHSDEERAVSQSFNRYMTAWERSDMKVVWNLMSDRMQAGNDNNEAEIEKDRETPDVRILGHSIKSIRISGDHATIEADVRFSANWGRMRGAELQRFEFVRERGRWVFDDEKPIKPS